MKLESSELAMMKKLIDDKVLHPDDEWKNETLNQYMEDLKNKYKISFSTHEFDLKTGEIIKIE